MTKQVTTTTDPVWGTTVETTVPVAMRLVSGHAGTRCFRSRGCKLESDEGPDAYLAPGYVPTMSVDPPDGSRWASSE